MARVDHLNKTGASMRIRTLTAGVLLLIPTLLFAQSKKKKTVPAVFGHATYVYVEAEDGDAFRPGLIPEDREAIEDVRTAIRDWNRYTLTATRDGAELLFIVRKGRLASGRLGVGVGNAGPFPGPRSTSTAGMAGGEAGPPDDLLEVRMVQPDGKLSGPIWERSQTNGLEPPRVALLRALRDAVEKDYPQ